MSGEGGVDLPPEKKDFPSEDPSRGGSQDIGEAFGLLRGLSYLPPILGKAFAGSYAPTSKEVRVRVTRTECAEASRKNTGKSTEPRS